MKYITAFASILVATMAAGDFGEWKLYCGTSCSGGTLIGSGDLQTNIVSSCTSLGASYSYCHLEVDPSNLNFYEAVISPEGNCNDGNPDTSANLGPAECTGAGTWTHYKIYYRA